MNGSIRVSAKTVDDAITEALIQLGVTSDRLEYEVIEKGSAGFLGIGMKQAVIEARRKPEPKEEKVEEPVVEEPVRVEPKKVEAVQPQKAAAEKKADEPQKAAFEKAVEKEVKEEVKKETKLVEVQPQTIKAVEDFLKNTMKAMDMEVELKTEIDQDGALCVDMSGEHMGILIGKRGQTLDSLQYLVSLIVKKALNMAKSMEIPVIGLVENYSYVICPDCGKEFKIFGESGLDKLAEELDLPILGRMPIDPKLAELASGEVAKANNEYLAAAESLLIALEG